jgi:hypothetical protein
MLRRNVFSLFCLPLFDFSFSKVENNSKEDCFFLGEDKYFTVNKQIVRIECLDGTKKWYLNGLLHREDGPAVEWSNGYKSWYLNGLLHREDGPAIEYTNGYKVWYLNGQRHRQDGPAVEYPNGDKYWYLNGELHR